MQRWLGSMLGLMVCSAALGCEITDGDDDDPRADAAAPRDGAIAGRGGSGGRDAASEGGSPADEDARVDEGDEPDEDAGPGRMVSCDEDNGGIRLPPGFCAVVFADDLGRARHLTVTPAGDVYVAIGNAPDGSTRGEVVALRDADGDQRAEQSERFGDNGGTGILWRDGQLYFAQDDRVLRYAAPNGQLLPSGEPAIIVSGLPADGDHKAKAIALEGDDLYVNIGSASNSCQQSNRTLESPGIDPCPELATRAGVWRFAADTVDQEQVDGARFVQGGRNLTALTVHPFSGELYAVLNGRDQLYENWPSLYTMLDDQRAPSEELFSLKEGADYGWPYCYYDEVLGRKVLAPEYGGDGETVGRCADVEGPLAVLPAHWAPLSMTFYEDNHFPARYRGGAFIANHGSRFEPQAPLGDLPGYNVVYQPFRAGEPSGAFEEFATGFAGDGRPLPEAAVHRPVGVAVGPDGSLYISDDVGGRIWRVFYMR